MIFPDDDATVEDCLDALSSVSREHDRELWATLQVMLGNAYVEREEGHPEANAEDALAAFQRAVEAHDFRVDKEAWFDAVILLGYAHADRLRGDPESNLAAAVATFNKILEVTTPKLDPAEWAGAKMAIADVYSDHADLINPAEYWDAAIQAYREILDIVSRTEVPEEWATTTRNLADAYCERLTGDRADNMEIAIELYLQVLEVQSPDTDLEEWAGTMTNLGLAYGDRIHGDRADNLEQALTILRQAADAAQANALDVWALAMSNLGNVYVRRVRGDVADNLEEAIAVLRQVLQAQDRDTTPREWADALVSLGVIYSERIRGDRSNNLEKAIDFLKQSFQVLDRESAPRSWAQAQTSLANTYTQRIEGDRAENLERALEAHRQALEVRTRESLPEEWAATWMNLGIVFSQRLHGDRAENLEQAIAAYLEALEVLTSRETLVEWAAAMINLGNAYTDRIDGERSENQEEAIRVFEEALEALSPDGTPHDWSLAMSNLAAVFTERTRGNRAENMDRAIEAHERVLEVRTKQSTPYDWAVTRFNLGASYAERLRGEHSRNLETAIDAYWDALEIFRPESFPFHCRRAASQLGEVALESGRWALAVEAYDLALETGEKLYQAAALQLSRGAELAEEPTLHRFAAYARGRLLLASPRGAASGSENASRWWDVIVTLERGRARGLGETLARDRAELEAIECSDPVLVKRYREAVLRLREVEILERSESRGMASSQVALHETARSVWNELETSVDALRGIPGHEGFLREPEFSDVAEAVEPGTPLIYWTITPVGSLAFILHRPRSHSEVELIPIELPDLRQESLGRLLVEPSTTSSPVSYLQAQLSQPEALKGVQEAVLAEVGKWAIRSVAAKLRKLRVRAVVLIPGGILGLLPLHAAPYRIEDSTRVLLEEFEVTYAPSARVLRASRRALEARSDSPALLVGLANPLPHPRPLEHAVVELEAVASRFPPSACHIVYGEEATRGALWSQPRATHLHVACHAVFQSNDPLESRLELAHGQRHTLEEIAEQHLDSARLVTLSACQTALTEFGSLPDEVVGLPAGFLGIGAAGVVATLWQVDDLSTALLMSRFYRYHLHGGPRSKEPPMTPAAALRKAQLWLRELTVEELIADLGHYRSDAPEGDAGRVRTAMEELAPEILSRYIYEDSQTRPFVSPFYWAPFVFLGA